MIGFPSGAHVTGVKAAEADRAETEGAEELDMVVNLGRAKGHDWAGVAADVADVRAAVQGTLKVIVESAALTPAELDEVARAAVDGGADYLKTSTGFHPAGGATAGGGGRPRRGGGRRRPTRRGQGLRRHPRRPHRAGHARRRRHPPRVLGHPDDTGGSPRPA